MKTQILQILQMQAEGKLTQAQAAELLAVLADQSRGEGATATAPAGAETQGAGPRTDPAWTRGGASAAIHGLIDSAVSMGTTVGRAATVIGGELVSMVHREQSGNTITLGKVELPSGEDFEFKDNTINVSKVSDVTLRHAAVTGNRINASKLAHMAITHGKFIQCDVSGSSVSHVTIEGSAADGEAAAPSPEPILSLLRATTFNATKFARTRVLGASRIETTAFVASAIKELELRDASALVETRVNDSAVNSTTLQNSRVQGSLIERSVLAGVLLKDVTFEGVAISHTRLDGSTFDGGAWTRTRFGRDVLGMGSGGRDSVVQESTFENCVLTDVEFVGCTFRRTTLRNVNLSKTTIRNVDFTGMTIDGDAALRTAAGLV